MKKILLSAILVAAAFSPMVLAAHPNTNQHKETEIKQTESFESINCSGKCDSCSKENCSRRRRPYKGDEE